MKANVHLHGQWKISVFILDAIKPSTVWRLLNNGTLNIKCQKILPRELVHIIPYLLFSVVIIT